MYHPEEKLAKFPTSHIQSTFVHIFSPFYFVNIDIIGNKDTNVLTFKC